MLLRPMSVAVAVSSSFCHGLCVAVKFVFLFFLQIDVCDIVCGDVCILWLTVDCFCFSLFPGRLTKRQ